jgi:hypothetical protein
MPESIPGLPALVPLLPHTRELFQAIGSQMPLQTFF